MIEMDNRASFWEDLRADELMFLSGDDYNHPYGLIRALPDGFGAYNY